MGVMYYILSPFSWLLNFFYSFTDSYGISLILFALVIKIILFPLTIKGKKGMIQMNLLSGKMQQLQKQYGKDRERYNMEVQRLYEREKVNPMSGCLWSFLPILILLPLYAIIRQPLLYLMGLDSNQIAQVAASVDWQTLAVNHGWVTADAMAKLVEQFNAGEIATVFQNVGYNQLYLASLVNENTLPAITAALAGEELASALPETSPIEEEKETAALESVSEAIDGSEEELSGEEAEEAEQDESGEEPDEDKSKDQAE